MGVVGALVIARWSWSLIRETGGVLIDAVPQGGDLAEDIRTALEHGEEKITDLHVWQVGPGHHAAIVSLSSPDPKAPSDYKARLTHLGALSHVTVEVQPV